MKLLNLAVFYVIFIGIFARANGAKVKFALQNATPKVLKTDGCNVVSGTSSIFRGIIWPNATVRGVVQSRTASLYGASAIFCFEYGQYVNRLTTFIQQARIKIIASVPYNFHTHSNVCGGIITWIQDDRCNSDEFYNIYNALKPANQQDIVGWKGAVEAWVFTTTLKLGATYNNESLRMDIQCGGTLDATMKVKLYVAEEN